MFVMLTQNKSRHVICLHFSRREEGGRDNSPIHTPHFLPLLALRPLLETLLVDVLPTGRFAPDDRIGVGNKIGEANGADAFDLFAVIWGGCFFLG